MTQGRRPQKKSAPAPTDVAEAPRKRQADRRSKRSSKPPARQSSTQADQAYRVLKQKILDNKLPPGTQLLELEAAALLNMSRTPVREAMVRLGQEGLISIRPRHGMRVLPISPDDTQEIYQILAALEAAAAEIVAAKPRSERGLDHFRQALADMAQGLENDDLEVWAEADERFHKLLIEFAGNKRLAALVNLHWEQAHRVRMVTLRLRPKPTASMADHFALVAAIEKGKPDAARKIHREHRRRGGQILIDVLRRHGLSSL